MQQEDQILGFEDVTVHSNDAGYVVISQYTAEFQDDSKIVLPASVVETLIKSLRKHKRLATEGKRDAQLNESLRGIGGF